MEIRSYLQLLEPERQDQLQDPETRAHTPQSLIFISFGILCYVGYSLNNGILQMSKSNYDSFPGGNLSFSLQIDENKLNERFKWILAMFGYFDTRLKSFEDRLSLSNFQSSMSPIIFERTFEKVSQETLNKMHEERENVYKELYNGLSKDITEKFTTAVLLEQEKRLEETRTLILGNISASAKSMERMYDDINRNSLRLKQLAKAIEEHQKTVNYQQPKPIFISEVSIQTAEQIHENRHSNDSIENKTISISTIQTIKQTISQNIKTLSSQIYQKINYDMMLINKKFQNMNRIIQNQQQKLKQFFDDSSMDDYSIEKKDDISYSPNKSIVNRSVSPSLRKRSTLFERNTSDEFEMLRRQIEMVKENQKTIWENRGNELKFIQDKIVTIESRLSRDVKDPSEQKWLKEKVQNHLLEMFNTPFEQKFSKKLNDSINKRVLDMKFDLMSYMKEIDKKVQEKVSVVGLKNTQREIEQKIALVKFFVEKKVNDEDQVNQKIKKVEEKISLSATKQRLVTEPQRGICLSCREPKTEFVQKRISSSSRKLPAKTLSQSFSINSYAKRFF